MKKIIFSLAMVLALWQAKIYGQDVPQTTTTTTTTTTSGAPAPATPTSRGVNLNITAGPELGRNVGSSIQHASVGSNIDTVHAVVSVKKGDIGVAFGASLDFRIAEALKLSLGYRGVRGVVDISDNS